jgi:hypothetical protein
MRMMPSHHRDNGALVAGFTADVELIDSLANQIADFRRVQLLHDGILKD